MKLNKILLTLSLIGSVIAHSQMNVTNTGTLKISSSTDTLYINGDFTNSSAASLTNNGKLYVKQNLTNDQASMSAGTGTLYLNGISTQTVGGSQIFKAYDFVSNNSAGIILNNDLSIANTHTFSAGLITTSSTPNYMVYEAGSSYSGDGDSKHVNGWVKKYGSTDFTFPVGDATYERTAALTGISVSSEFNCQYKRSTTNLFSVQGPLVSVDSAEYWNINKVSGGTAQVVLNWNASKVPFPNVLISDVAVADYTGGLWTDAGGTASGNVSTTGTITSNSKSSFSPFSFGFKSFPLPLKLISFTADKRNGFVLTQWVTENEQNVNHYEVQRSSDATRFLTISSKDARNLPYTQQYEFEDHSPLSDIIYYRLKSIDNDGKYSYSKIIAISNRMIDGPGDLVILNPVHSAITILNKTIQNGEYNYQLNNAAGQILQKGIINMSANSVSVLQLSSATPAGIYLLEIRSAETYFRKKIIVE